MAVGVALMHRARVEAAAEREAFEAMPPNARSLRSAVLATHPEVLR